MEFGKRKERPAQLFAVMGGPGSGNSTVSEALHARAGQLDGMGTVVMLCRDQLQHEAARLQLAPAPRALTRPS